MQSPLESKPKVSDDHQPTPKKRKTPVKKQKSEDKQQVKSEVDPTVGTNSVDPTPRSPGPFRGKCLYQSRKCENERAVKRNGKPHNLCEEHRSKQNQHQRKFDAKKFSRKRRRGSGSDDEERPAIKHHRTGDDEAEAETRPPMTTPMVAAMRGSYPPMYVAGSTRLPSIQSPTGPTPALAYAQTIGTEAYPRGHVTSDYHQQTSYGTLRPFLQQTLPAYSHSELVAASILVQPQSVLSPPSAVATPGLVFVKQERPVVGEDRGQARITPRMLPSLRVPLSHGLSPSPFLQVGRIVPSPAQGFASVVTPTGASVCPSIPLGNILPPLVPFSLRRSPTPMSSPNSQNK